MQYSPVFTVIITTYKRQAALKNAIKSVLAQSFREFECIIINDNPSDNDGIRNLITLYKDNRLRFEPAIENKGANYCRNKGIEEAKGRYIAFLDDDDIWFQNKLEKHFKCHTNEEADLVFSSYIKKKINEKGSERLIMALPVPKNIVKAMARGSFSISTTSSVTIKRSSIYVPFFDEKLVSFQDWDAWMSLVLKNPAITFCRIEQPLLYFIQHEGDRTSRNIQKRNKGFEQVTEKYKGIKGIQGFYVKELMNLRLMQAEEYSVSTGKKKLFLLTKFLQYPGFWFRQYAVKKTIKYLLMAK